MKGSQKRRVRTEVSPRVAGPGNVGGRAASASAAMWGSTAVVISERRSCAPKVSQKGGESALVARHEKIAHAFLTRLLQREYK
jgi:hypothetical protein